MDRVFTGLFTGLFILFFMVLLVLALFNQVIIIDTLGKIETKIESCERCANGSNTRIDGR